MLGRGIEDVLLRQRAVGKRLELEIVVVPGEAEAGLLGRVADLAEPRAEAAPAGGVGRPRVGGEYGQIDQL